MTQPPPVPLEYRGRGEPRKPDPNALGRFQLGLIGGIVLSTFAYLFGWKLFPNGTVQLAIGIAVLKFAIGLACVLMPRRRALGVGILTSLPVGVMIFFGSCAVVHPDLRILHSGPADSSGPMQWSSRGIEIWRKV